jgi:predicted amidophosphoribosyltransferase
MMKAKQRHRQGITDSLYSMTDRVRQLGGKFFQVNCSHCAEEIPMLTSTCRHCGKSQRQVANTIQEVTPYYLDRRITGS